MTPRPAQRLVRRALHFSAVSVALGSAGACGDLPSGPLVEVTTEEVLPTLHFESSLPTFPEVLDRWGGRLPADTFSERWIRSWELSSDEGAREREVLYREIAPRLARSFSTDDLAPIEERLDEALARVAADLPAAASDRIVVPVSEARRSAAAARDARLDGDVPVALRYLLVAVDHLHSATPGPVAQALIRDGEGALRRNTRETSYSEQDRERAERLLLGARDALERRDQTLALRRAFYGQQILTETEDP